MSDERTLNSPHDVPSVEQIVQAVREWIERDLVPATSGRIQFHGRVAANMLGIVERELELGPAQREAHGRRLASLGVDSDAALAEAIRSGALDERLDDVVSAVRAAVEDKLRVANPSYFAT
jgi:hypothetical protein